MSDVAGEIVPWPEEDWRDVPPDHPDHDFLMDTMPYADSHRRWPGGEVCVQCRRQWPCPAALSGGQLEGDE